METVYRPGDEMGLKSFVGFEKHTPGHNPDTLTSNMFTNAPYTNACKDSLYSLLSFFAYCEN